MLPSNIVGCSKCGRYWTEFHDDGTCWCTKCGSRRPELEKRTYKKRTTYERLRDWWREFRV